MAKHRERMKVEVVRLGIEFTYVAEWKRNLSGQWVPKKLATAPAGSALVFKGEGEDQEITWMDWDDAMDRYEPEDEIGQDDDDTPRVAATRRRDRSYRYDDDRRDGYREPRYGDDPMRSRRYDETTPVAPAWAYPAPPPLPPVPPQRNQYGGPPPVWPMPNSGPVAPTQNGAVPKDGGKA